MSASVPELGWSEGVLKATPQGERLLKVAAATDEWVSRWQQKHIWRAQLQEQGLALSDDGRQFLWWSIPGLQADARESLILSRASDLDIELPCPDGLGYMPFQRAGIHYASTRQKTLIGDDMGLGKTVQALGVINNTPSVEQVLVVCPASLKINWKRESEKWLIPRGRGWEIEIAEGKYWPAVRGHCVIVCNYDILVKHEKVLSGTAWDLMVVDECHYLKNQKAQRTRVMIGGSVKRGGKKFPGIHATRELWLTGTPIENRPVEIWTAAHRLAPHEFPNWFKFGLRYCDMKPGFAGSKDVSGASNLGELQTKLRRSCMIRRRKAQVLTELPPKRRQVIELPASTEIKSVLNRERMEFEIHEETLVNLRARRELAAVNEDELVYREVARELKDLQQIMFTEMSRIRKETGVLKAPLVAHHVGELIGAGLGKVIVFCHHGQVIDMLMEALDAYNPVKIDGRMVNKSERMRSVDRFQTDPGCRVFVGSIGAAGVGLTLTESSTVVFAEGDWVPGRVTQAEDRAHRIGQVKSVLVQHLVMEGSIDAKMMHKVVNKQEVIDHALDILPGDDGDQRAAPDAAGSLSGGGKFERKHKAYAEIGRQMTDAQRKVAHRCMRVVADMDRDGASVANNAGFSKVDTVMGHVLAEHEALTIPQAALARALALKYRRQIDPKLIAILSE